MQVFFVGSSLPSPGHSARAATVLVRSALLAFQELGLDVTFQPLLAFGDPAIEGELDSIRAWAGAQGIEILDPLLLDGQAHLRRFGTVRQVVGRGPARFYPGWTLRTEMRRRIEASRADFVFHLWSSAALAACVTSPVPVFAYYGNPDHKPVDARLRNPALFDDPRGRARLALARVANLQRRRVNVELLRTARWAANVCAVDAAFFAREGHPNSFYLQNMWPQEPVGEPTEVVAEPNKIVGNVGGLYATGNTFGLSFLAREIVPALERRLGTEFSVHVYGAGQPSSAVAGALAHPRIALRGFVDDIDSELMSAQVFLLANNNYPGFVVGHTRVLHAWSLGMCLVGHRNTARAMPEVEHDVNALLGESAEEIADLVVRALRDDALRAQIATAGRRTLEREFLPRVVVGRVIERVRSL